MKGNKRKQKGITLIALIITIIVMLILVGVTINVALNGGLFTTAQTATKETQIEADREQLLSAVVASYETETGVISKVKLVSNLGDKWQVDGEGPYTVTSPKGNVFIVDVNGNITDESENGGTSEEDNIVPDELKKYILGANELGRIMFELDEAGNQIDGILDFEEITFLDDPLTEDVDETQTLGIECLLVGYNEDATKTFVYAKYNNKAYRITANETIKEKKYETEKLEVIYEPKGTEGQTTADGWTILYDNGETAEAVSPTAMGELRLGHSGTGTTEEESLAEAIESYNNAITTINNYCKILEGLPSNSSIRSVGAGVETTTAKYSSDILPNSLYNGVGLKGDTNYEQDLVRMTYWGVYNLETNYWVASRYVNGGRFGIYYGGDIICLDIWDHLWIVTSGNTTSSSNSRAVRPIITITNI